MQHTTHALIHGAHEATWLEEVFFTKNYTRYNRHRPNVQT